MKKFFYRVVEGDTVFSVSRSFKISITTLINLNSLTAEISAGDILYIETDGSLVYSVQPFDSYYSVAKKFCVSESKLRADNNFDYIFYGLSLKI
jgi:spore germination protein YaaH